MILCENSMVKLFLVDLEEFLSGHGFSIIKFSQTKMKVGSKQQNPYYTHLTECRLILILSVSLEYTALLIFEIPDK